MTRYLSHHRRDPQDPSAKRYLVLILLVEIRRVPDDAVALRVNDLGRIRKQTPCNRSKLIQLLLPLLISVPHRSILILRVPVEVWSYPRLPIHVLLQSERRIRAVSALLGALSELGCCQGDLVPCPTDTRDKVKGPDLLYVHSHRSVTLSKG